jgi:hypothetical protein
LFPGKYVEKKLKNRKGGAPSNTWHTHVSQMMAATTPTQWVALFTNRSGRVHEVFTRCFMICSRIEHPVSTGQARDDFMSCS